MRRLLALVCAVILYVAPAFAHPPSDADFDAYIVGFRVGFEAALGLAGQSVIFTPDTDPVFRNGYDKGFLTGVSYRSVVLDGGAMGDGVSGGVTHFNRGHGNAAEGLRLQNAQEFGETMR